MTPYTRDDATFSVQYYREFPFLASLLFQDRQDLVATNYIDGAHCMGAFLSRFVVVTTAHCFFNATTNATYRYVRINDANYDMLEATYSDWVELRPSNYRLHEDFNLSTLANDIGLVYLTQQVAISDIKPIDYESRLDYGLRDFTLIGYGRLPSRTLRYSLVTLGESDNTCQAVFGPRVCNDRGVRTGYNSATKKSAICGLNSGSPLVNKRNIFSRHRLIALASFVEAETKCDLSRGEIGNVNNVAVTRVDGYVYIPHYASWISRNIVRNAPLVYESWGMSF